MRTIEYSLVSKWSKSTIHVTSPNFVPITVLGVTDARKGETDHQGPLSLDIPEWGWGVWISLSEASEEKIECTLPGERSKWKCPGELCFALSHLGVVRDSERVFYEFPEASNKFKSMKNLPPELSALTLMREKMISDGLRALSPCLHGDPTNNIVWLLRKHEGREREREKGCSQ